MKTTRRAFLKSAGLLTVLPSGCLGLPGHRKPVLVNDVHSQLNLTRVDRVLTPRSVEALRGAVLAARARDQVIGICGSRHAMGGQQFVTDGCLIDVKRMNRVIGFDRRAGIVEVESGIQWPELVEWLLLEQSDEAEVWSIAQKQTGADRLTLGGALAANIHGRGLAMRPFIGDIESFDLVDAEGGVRRCSRTENPELFRLAVGGYGLLGLVHAIRLRLARRRKLRREVQVIRLEELVPAFEERIRDGFLYGDFQFDIDPGSSEFLERGVFSCYGPVLDDTPMPPRIRLTQRDWKQLIYLAHADPGRAFREYASYYLKTSGQVYWSDLHQFSDYLAGYHVELDQRLGESKRASEIITELYVPPEALVSFMRQCGDYLRRHHVRVIYGTIRRIEPDHESFLPWANRQYVCVIFNLHTDHARVEHSAAAFRHLIDVAIAHEGNYYLTYHRFATREQVLACYPQFPEFLEHKRAWDPDELFQSDWYRHHKALL